MNFILQRFSDNRDSTLGLLFKVIEAPAKRPYFMGYTLEDEQRDIKVMKETRIPAGFYEIGIQKADTPLTLKYRSKYPWFKNHLEIKNVPGFTSVYIHIGNTDADSAACILVGDAADNNNTSPGTITNSTVAFKRLYGDLFEHLEKGGKAHIQIRDEKELL